MDQGEASAIALALELYGSVVILDDDKARKVARSLGVEITGTMGILLRVKIEGYIPWIEPLLSSLKRAGFYISPALELKILTEAGEHK
ncbi:MAG TPA: DUF3368 domain-containing protein [Candidatus Kapabacteria bacterium]|nr:DUF3368 domain-containing protein [Candidatus Kapabacteria bacterium]